MTSHITTTEEALHHKGKFASSSGDLKSFMLNADNKNIRMLKQQALKVNVSKVHRCLTRPIIFHVKWTVKLGKKKLIWH